MKCFEYVLPWLVPEASSPMPMTSTKILDRLPLPPYDIMINKGTGMADTDTAYFSSFSMVRLSTMPHR